MSKSSNREYVLSEKISKIEQLLEDSSFVDNIGEDTKVEVVSELFLDSDIIENGFFNLTYDVMHMNAFLEIKKSINCPSDFDLSSIFSYLENENESLYKRIDWDVVNTLYENVMVKDLILPKQKIAEGVAIKAAVPEYLIVKQSLIPGGIPEVKTDGHVDYHHIHSFIYVSKNELLADVIPEFKGENGVSLIGKEIQCPTIVKNYYKCGSNTFVNKNKVYSEIDGTFKIVNNSLIVEPSLNIITDIDYHTGDIDFHGDVSVTGTVREGFIVKTSGDLLISESLEASNIECGNNLVVNEGIIGSESHQVTCKGTVETKYIDHSNVRSHGDILVNKSISNSFLCTMGSLIMGKKSECIGGVLHCQNSFIAGNVGNKSEVETIISLGLDFSVDKKIRQINNSLTDIDKELEEIQVTLQSATKREERDKIKYLFLALKNRRNSLNNHQRSLLSKLDVNDKAYVIVHGTIFPGVSIEICHVCFVVKQEMRNIKFHLKKETGEVVAEHLK